MEAPKTWLRPFEETDARACAVILHAAVHELAGRYYSREQKVAWAPEVMSTDDMLKRLRGQDVFVAEDLRGIAGFMSLRPPDDLDFAYVRPDCAAEAWRTCCTRLSLMPPGVQGFQLCRPTLVNWRGVSLKSTGGIWRSGATSSTTASGSTTTE